MFVPADEDGEAYEVKLPRHVEDAMADIAVVFSGWTPDVMSRMSVEELVQWHERARVRYEMDVKARRGLGLNVK